MEPKNQNLKQGVRDKLFIPFDSSQRASHFSVFVCQNLMKYGQVMTMPSVCATVALAILSHKP